MSVEIQKLVFLRITKTRGQVKEEFNERLSKGMYLLLSCQKNAVFFLFNYICRHHQPILIYNLSSSF